MAYKTEEKNISTQVAPLYDIISAPLVATIDADFIAAERFVQFIRKYGFEELLPGEKKEYETDGENNYFGKLKFVEFSYTDDRGEIKVYKIPTLSLIPLPDLIITDASFQFDIRIIGGEVPKQAPSLVNDEPEPEPEQKVMATLTPLSSEEQANPLAPSMMANVRAKINVRQADIPAGILALLNIMGDSVQQENIPRKIKEVKKIEQ